jgi:hypothetical protein
MQRIRLAIYVQMLEDDMPGLRALYPTTDAFNPVFLSRAQSLMEAAAPADQLWLESRLDDMLWWYGREPIILRKGIRILVLSQD